MHLPFSNIPALLFCLLLKAYPSSSHGKKTAKLRPIQDPEGEIKIFREHAVKLNELQDKKQKQDDFQTYSISRELKTNKQYDMY